MTYREIISTSLDDDIAVMTVKPCRSGILSAGDATALQAALRGLSGKPGVRGLVLSVDGGGLLGGELADQCHDPAADISSVAEELAALDMPSVFVLQGEMLGSSLELALAARFRLALPDTVIGLPQARLGFSPGAGGLRRMAELAGATATQRLAGDALPISAQEAQNLGLVDIIAAGEPIAAAKRFLKSHSPTGRLGRILPDADPAALDRLAAAQQRKLKNDIPMRIRDLLRVSDSDIPARERRLHLDTIASPAVAPLRHLFLAERAAARPEAHGAGPGIRSIGKVGIIGAGTMGGGIALSFAKAGFDVRINDRNDAALQSGLKRMAGTLDHSVARGSIPRSEAEAQIARIRGTTALADLADCDLIIEAAFEDIQIKRELFRDIDRIARAGAVLATNTSYLDVNAIASVTSRAADVLGLHFFSPANVMSLLEIVRGRETSQDVVATAMNVAGRIGKQPVVVGVCYGFVGNRMLSARNAEVSALVLDGAAPSEVDAAFRSLGWPMGPCEMGDLVGLDTSWRIRQGRGAVDPLQDRLVELERFGQKNGKGWYRYEDGRTPCPDADVDRLIEKVAAEHGVQRRTISEDEIIARTHDPMIAEAHSILKEGIVRRASDIDVIYTHGYGFPRHLGGPMYWNEKLRRG